MQAYALAGFSPSEVTPDASVQLANVAGAQTSNQLTVCFTRQLASVGQSGVEVTLAGSTPMNFAGANHISLLAYTTSPEDDEEEEGGVIWTAPGTRNYVNWHGGMMVTAWVALAPLGIIIARHKWLLVGRGQLWSQLHRGIQAAAALLALIGFIIPFSTFGAGFELDSSDTPTTIHSTLGALMMLLLSIHVTLAFFRPAPDTPSRYLWKALHFWNGSVLLFFSVANIGLGVLLYRHHFDSSGIRWIIPAILLLVFYSVLNVALGLTHTRDCKRSLEGTGEEQHQLRGVEFVGMGYMPYQDSAPGR
ncbi:MAG: hypothetical protein WDW38_009515 [Sanguina aurantia]